MNHEERRELPQTRSSDFTKQAYSIQPLRAFLAGLLWLSAAAFGIWYGTTAFQSRPAHDNLAGDAEVDRASPNSSKEVMELKYPDPDSPIAAPVDPFDPAPTIRVARFQTKRATSLAPVTLLASRQRLFVDVDMHRLLANPCFAGLETLFHDRIVQPVLKGLGLELSKLDRVMASLSYSQGLDWYSNPILRFFVHHRRYLHAPMCLMAQVHDSQIDILTRLHHMGPLTAASILGKRVFYGPTGLAAAMPSPGYVVMCKGGDITELLRRWPRTPQRPKPRPLPANLVMTAELNEGSGKKRTQARLKLIDDGTRIEVRISLTGDRRRLWRSRLRRALRSMVQSAWARRTALSWQVDAAHWRISPDGSTVQWSLERTCTRLRGYLQDVLH